MKFDLSHPFHPRQHKPLTKLIMMCIIISVFGLTGFNITPVQANPPDPVNLIEPIKSRGTLASLHTTALPPMVWTTGASSIKENSALLCGIVDPAVSVTVVTFEVGLTTAYGTTVTAAQSPLTLIGALSEVSQSITGLSPNTTYHYRVVAENSAGTAFGTDRTFKTLPAPPTAITNSAKNITVSSATLQGIVNANNDTTTVTFEYGLDTGYGTIVTADQSPVTGVNWTDVSHLITGLMSDTTYHFRVVGENIAGTRTGDDKTFRTQAAPPELPSVLTYPAEGVTSTGAALKGLVNANNNDATVTFEYGLTTAYGITVTADQSPVTGNADTAVSTVLTGLAPNTTYHFRVVGENLGGKTNGADFRFTTLTQPPTATTNPANVISGSKATLNGTVNAHNDDTTVTFEYGLDNTYGTTVTASQSPVTGLADTKVSALLTGLTPDTTYHFRVVGVNSTGSANGADQTFKTDVNLNVTVDQAVDQPDPTNLDIIRFTIVFNKPIDRSTLTPDDIVIEGVSRDSLTITLNEDPNDGTIFELSLEGLTESCTVSAQINSNTVKDLNNEGNTASTSTDNQVSYDINSPGVGTIDLKKKITSDKSPRQIVLEFSEAVYDPPGSSDADDVTNPNNYLLIEKGSNHMTDTLSCSDGVKNDDVQIDILRVSYNDGTYQAQLDLSQKLPIGSYALFVCGTTSIVDLAGNPINNGQDQVFDFRVIKEDELLPETGFAPGVVTTLPVQPAINGYHPSTLVLEIPSLGVKMDIVGIPQNNGTWDVTWLGENAGYLEHSAFPTWPGNTVLTGHVWNAQDQPGPFTHLKTLSYGDLILIHAFGMTYTYEVREEYLVVPEDISTVFQSELLDWVTLVTCEFFDPESEQYQFRRIVHAVLVNVE